MDLLEHSRNHWFYIQVASLASLAQLLPPCSPTWLFGTEQLSVQSCWPRDCVRFGYFFLVAVARSLCPLIRYSCSQSPISTAPRLCPLWLLLPDCIHFDCYTPIASACSLTCSGRFQPMPNMFSNFLCRVWGSVNNWSTKVARHQSSPTPRTSHERHSHTHTHTR